MPDVVESRLPELGLAVKIVDAQSGRAVAEHRAALATRSATQARAQSLASTLSAPCASEGRRIATRPGEPLQRALDELGPRQREEQPGKALERRLPRPSRSRATGEGLLDSRVEGPRLVLSGQEL